MSEQYEVKIYAAGDDVGRLTSELARVFGGATSYPGEGIWYDAYGVKYSEPSVTVVVVVDSQVRTLEARLIVHQWLRGSLGPCSEKSVLVTVAALDSVEFLEA